MLLILAGLNGLLGWTVETCTGNVADAPFTGVITLALNTVGMVMLAWRPAPMPLFIALVAPVALAVPYTVKTFALAHGYLVDGLGVCDVVTSSRHWGPNGDEPALLALWVGATAVFWVGVAVSFWRAYRTNRRVDGVAQGK